MAVCLDYQAVYCQREGVAGNWCLLCLAAMTLLLALVFRVWIKIETTDVGYRLAHEREQTISFDNTRRDLELQLSLLKRQDYLTQRAKATLGLQPLNPNQARKIRY